MNSIAANSSAAEDQKEDEVQLGFWLFLMSDAVLFGLLFATYAIMANNIADGPTGTEIFDLTNLSMQTVLLLISTLTIAIALRHAQTYNVRGMVIWLIASCILGAGFIILELRELGGLVLAGNGPSNSGFLSAFFTLVGMHGVHVTAGIIWGVTLVLQLGREGVSERILSRMARLTYFWHFLDIVWIGVYSTIYLPWIMA
ncbi:MAG: cytochrome c oxidase subunit 3 [Rhizobiaceae bacterium]